jgi:hypothetical protein
MLQRWIDGFIFPPKEAVLPIFIAVKSLSSSAGFVPANLGSKYIGLDKHILCITINNNNNEFTIFDVVEDSCPPKITLRLFDRNWRILGITQFHNTPMEAHRGRGGIARTH